MSEATYTKTFPVSWQELHRDAKALAWRLHGLRPWRGVVAITRGGLVPAAIVARELGLAGVGIECIKAIEAALRADGMQIPINIDGAFAANLYDLGLPPAAGKLLFIDLQDWTGRIQLFVGKAQVGEHDWALAANMDLGDLIGVDGERFAQRLGDGFAGDVVLGGAEAAGGVVRAKGVLDHHGSGLDCAGRANTRINSMDWSPPGTMFSQG